MEVLAGLVSLAWVMFLVINWVKQFSFDVWGIALMALPLFVIYGALIIGVTWMGPIGLVISLVWLVLSAFYKKKQ